MTTMTIAPPPETVDLDKPAVKGDKVYLDYTRDRMIEQIVLLEDHLLSIAADRDVLQCLACSYWHLQKLIAYDCLERIKFDPDYDDRFLIWAQKALADLPKLKEDRNLARKLALELREWRYFFAGEEEVDIPLVVQNRPLCPKLAEIYGIEMGKPKKDIKAEIAELYDCAISKKCIHKVVEYRQVDHAEAERIKKATGLEVEGYWHAIDAYAVRHIQKEHGDPSRESSRGQIAVTKEDILQIPTITLNPDAIKPMRTALGKDAVAYIKKINGDVFYLEEVRTGRKHLAATTMRKYKAGAPNVLLLQEQPPALTSETFPGKDNIAHKRISVNGSKSRLEELYGIEMESPAAVKITGTCTDDGCHIKVRASESAEASTGSFSEIPKLIERVKDSIKRSRKESAKTMALGPSGKRYEFVYEIADLDDLITSHDPFTFEPNPKYPQELQPRLRDRAATRLQVERIAAGLDPDALLSDFRSLDRGAPIVGPDGIVESGNGRVMALKRAAKEHPEKYAAYQAELIGRLSSFGLTEKSLGKAARPVLVRRRTSKIDRKAFVEEANAASTLERSAVETARTDAEANIPKNEIGAAICRCDTGYELGPMVMGTPDSVRVPKRCRSGCEPVGTVHTHPGGPVRLSGKDVESLCKANLRIGCVTDGKTMRCYEVERRN